MKTNGKGREKMDLEKLIKSRPFGELIKSGAVIGAAEAARKLGISLWGVRAACGRGKLKYFKRGTRYFFQPQDIDALFNLRP